MNNTNTTEKAVDLQLQMDSAGYISSQEFARQFHQYFQAKNDQPKVESATAAAFKAIGFWK